MQRGLRLIVRDETFLSSGALASSVCDPRLPWVLVGSRDPRPPMEKRHQPLTDGAEMAAGSPHAGPQEGVLWGLNPERSEG